MSKPLVYIAGPISKPDPLLNARAGVLLYRRMIVDGVVTPLCPHLSILVPLIAGGGTDDYDFWLPYDFEVITHCAAVYRMEGESHGADREVEHAYSLDIPVFRTIDGLYAYFERRAVI